MIKSDLTNLIFQKKSVLCVGLDTDINKIPAFFRDMFSDDEVVFQYNKRIIDETLPYAVAYKPNLAFYESRGVQGLIDLKKTLDYIHSLDKSVFLIADAKRGDIGNTSGQYATAFFDEKASGFSFDAVTVAPYMGKDSVSPFLKYDGKWIVVLALTSNAGADDFQMLKLDKSYEDELLFEKVLRTSSQWGTDGNMMYVVGATRAEMLKKIRQIIPNHFLLIPGVGAQGGSLIDVLNYGWNNDGGLLINASRSIIFASDKEDFASAAANEAKRMQCIMAEFIEKHK